MKNLKTKWYLISTGIMIVFNIFSFFLSYRIIHTALEAEWKRYKAGNTIYQFLRSLFSNPWFHVLFPCIILVWITTLVLNMRAIKREERGATLLFCVTIFAIVLFAVAAYLVICQ